jgi:hypothetical protein
MPRSLLLPLIAVFALAACSKQADTGAAPAPETVEATDDAAAAPADTTAAAVEDTTAPVEAEVPAEEPAADATVPAEEPAADAPMDEPMDDTVPADSATTWPSDSAAAQ